MSSMTTPTQAKILNGKDFLTMKESTPTAIADLLKLAQTIKGKLQAGEEYTPLKGKRWG